MSDVWESIRQAIDEDRLAHAYLLDGSPMGEGAAFALKMVQYLFCTEEDRSSTDCEVCRRVEARTHTDVLWVEPRSKSRRILVDQIDEAIHRIQQSSFEGGWKVCIITYADTMNPESSNKFLKTLEEPPARTLMLLVSDQVTSILPTIRSRCQRVMLPKQHGFTEQPWMEPLLTLLRGGPPTDTLRLLSLARAFEDVFKLAQKEIEAAVSAELKGEEPDDKVIDARVRAKSLETWQTMLLFIQAWHRDLLLLVSDAGSTHLTFPAEEDTLRAIAETLTFARAYAKLAEVENMARRIARNLPVQEVFEAGLAV
jgi:DNA polymerase-3 subunit delta'